jgi:uncharacterized protein with WD repeat
VTYSPHADDHPSDMKRLIIWDIRTGIEKRNFSSDGPAIWPIFRWSQDDRFFARIGSDVLSVYETPVRVLRIFPSLDLMISAFLRWYVFCGIIFSEDSDVTMFLTG